jgi:hypothetical protein
MAGIAFMAAALAGIHQRRYNSIWARIFAILLAVDADGSG